MSTIHPRTLNIIETEEEKKQRLYAAKVIGDALIRKMNDEMDSLFWWVHKPQTSIYGTAWCGNYGPPIDEKAIRYSRLDKLEFANAELLDALEEIANFRSGTNCITDMDALQMRGIARAAIAKHRAGKEG